MVLTLASNNMKTYIPRDNISFAVECKEENEETKKIESFTRIYLKEIKHTDKDFPPWVDVKESVKLFR